MTVSVPALAQQNGFYFGAGAGTTDFDVCGSLAGLGVTSCDDKDSGFKVYAGMGISPNLAVEVGWVDLGKATATGPGGSASVKADGIQAAALGILPINPRFRVFGKAGVYAWDASASGPGGSLSDDGIDIMFGVGLAWNMAPRLDLRAEWERFDVDGDDVDMLSVGVQYSF
jgi:OOP family OmpA-OmpF porin